MKKVVRMSLLALTAVALLGSCKKKNNEPKPEPGTGTTNGGGSNGSGTNTPVDLSHTIELQLADGQTSFTLVGLNGSDVLLEGATSEGLVATDGNVEEWGYNANAPVQKTFTAPAGGKITIKGSIRSIAIVAGHFKNIDLSKAPDSFRGFYFFEIGDSGTISLETLKTEGLKSLEAFYLGFSPNRRYVGPNRLPAKVDISTSVGIKELFAHQTQVKTASSLPELKTLLLSEASSTDLATFTTSNYPKLERLEGYGARYNGQSQINFAGHQTLQQVFFRRTHVPLPINISNSPSLRSFRTQEALFYGNTRELNLLNTPSLTASTLSLNGNGTNTLRKEGLNVSTYQGWNVLTQ